MTTQGRTPRSFFPLLLLHHHTTLMQVHLLLASSWNTTGSARSAFAQASRTCGVREKKGKKAPNALCTGNGKLDLLLPRTPRSKTRAHPDAQTKHRARSRPLNQCSRAVGGSGATMQAGWATNAANAATEDANYERTMRLAEVCCGRALTLDMCPILVQPLHHMPASTCVQASFDLAHRRKTQRCRRTMSLVAAFPFAAN